MIIKKLLDIAFLLLTIAIHIGIFLICFLLMFSPFWPLTIIFYTLFLFSFKDITIELWTSVFENGLLDENIFR